MAAAGSMSVAATPAPLAGASAEDQQEGKYKYKAEIQAMMYTFGDVRDPLPATAETMEEIVRAHIMKLASDAYAVTVRRGSRQMTTEDVVFVSRGNKEQLGRIASYLSWSNVRKNVKQTTGGGNQPDEVSELFEDDDKLKQPGRKRIKLNFDILPHLTDGIRGMDALTDSTPSALLRSTEYLDDLQELDNVTRGMAADEYMEFTECRQASYTNKKIKRFRDWLCLGTFMEMKPNEEAIEVLGFLAWHFTKMVTKLSLQVQRDMAKSEALDNKRAFIPTLPRRPALFSSGSSKVPLQPEHIREAHRRLQATPRHSQLFRGIRRGASLHFN